MLNVTQLFEFKDAYNFKFSKGEVAAAVICLLIVAGIAATASLIINESKQRVHEAQ